MKTAVFFDIDGTLWDSQMQIPKSTIDAIHKLQENGNYAFICSGRSRATIRARELLEEIRFDGIVAGCGTYIEYNGEVIFERSLSQKEIADLLTELENCHMPAILEGKHYLYADEESFGDDPYIDYLKRILDTEFLPLKEYAGNYEVNKLSADFTKGDIPAVKKALSDQYELVFHEKQVVEILPKGFSKASGIEKVCGYLGISHENTYAFGDSANDVEMLKYAAHGIAMGNATDDAKEAADHITTSLWEDGIKTGLEYFSLI